MPDKNFTARNGLTVGDITGTATGQLVIGPKVAVVAQGTTGVDTQVLTSNGTAVYWAFGSSGAKFGSYINQTFTGDGTTKTFTITGGYTVGFINVFLNGVRVANPEVNTSDGKVITFVNAPENGQIIDVTGTLSTNTIDTTKSYNWSAFQTFSANISVTSIVANGSLGLKDQVLTSNGSAVYWGVGGGGGGNFNAINVSFTGDGTTTTYAIPGGYTVGCLNVFLNGVRMGSTEVNTSDAKNIIFANPPAQGMPIDVTGILNNASASIDTTQNYTWSGQNIYTGNISLKGLLANNTLGTAGQVLNTNGTNVYWGPGGGGTDPNALQKAQNLADLTDKAAARTNLQLGDSSIRNVGTTNGTVAAGDDGRFGLISGALQKSQNLADIPDDAAARTNIGLGNSATRNVGTTAGTVAAGDDARIINALQKSQNLADIPDDAAARTNIGLGDSSTRNIGTTTGTVAAGDDARITNALQKSQNLADVPDDVAARNNIGVPDKTGSGATGTWNISITGNAATATNSNQLQGITVGTAANQIIALDANAKLPAVDGSQLTNINPIGNVRAWVNFNGTGTASIRGSGGVTSLTDNGTGSYTINFATPFVNAIYAAVANYTESNSATGSGNDGQASCHTYATGSVRVFCARGDGSSVDPQVCALAVFRN